MPEPPITPEATDLPAPVPPASGPQPVASYIHTALIVLLMAVVAAVSAMGHKDRTGGPMGIYISTAIWQWALFGLVYFGMRRNGVSLRTIIGPRYQGFDDSLIDFVWAVGFFIGSKIVLAAIFLAAIKLMGIPDSTFSISKTIEAAGPLTPHTAQEIAAWIGLSMTAGFVEEIVFRGYLQRQFIAITRSATAGIVLSAVIFGAAHAYQGGAQMLVITALGAMFGILAYWRKSLKPGIIAHAGQDIISGLALAWLSSHPIH